MSTVALDIWTGAYPTITVNDITVNVYDQSAPLAIIATLVHPQPHLADSWSFPGLNRVNLLFKIFETVPITGAVVRQLGDDMNVVPGSKSGVNYRVTEQIEAGVTVGMTPGVNSFTFDGTSGTEDWRGWDIDTIDRMGGTGPMKKGIDYSWNPTTGKFMLLNGGDVFGPSEWFNVQFAAQIIDVTDSVPTSFPIFNTPKIITANYNVSAGSDFGGLLIIKPAGNYLELQLPDIATVVPGKLLIIEFAPFAGNKCIKILTQAAQIIDWKAGNLGAIYMCPQESVALYRFIDPAGPTNQWRVFNPFGNFLRVGEHVNDDNIAANVFNKVPFDGIMKDNQQFARLYNEFVLALPGGEVVNFDDWATGNNIYKFSLANSAILANAGQFMVPLRFNTFERVTDGSRKPGDFQGQALQQHRHTTHGFGAIIGAGFNWFLSLIGGRYSAGGGSDGFGGKKGAVDTNMQTGDFGGTETRPNNIAIRKYCMV